MNCSQFAAYLAIACIFAGCSPKDTGDDRGSSQASVGHATDELWYIGRESDLVKLDESGSKVSVRSGVDAIKLGSRANDLYYLHDRVIYRHDLVSGSDTKVFDASFVAGQSTSILDWDVLDGQKSLIAFVLSRTSDTQLVVVNYETNTVVFESGFRELGSEGNRNKEDIFASSASVSFQNSEALFVTLPGSEVDDELQRLRVPECIQLRLADASTTRMPGVPGAPVSLGLKLLVFTANLTRNLYVGSVNEHLRPEQVQVVNDDWRCIVVGRSGLVVVDRDSRPLLSIGDAPHLPPGFDAALVRRHSIAYVISP